MYDFNKKIDRFNTCSVKWGEAHELPMWIADMDFQTAPAIIQALQDRVSHGIFGYNTIPDRYYESIQAWWKTSHHFDIQKEWILFSSNVIPAISSIIRTFSDEGDQVLLQSPVYHTFYRCILSNKRLVVDSALLYENQQYRIDFEDLALKISDPKTKIMILCNPHNPISKIWSKEELRRIAELCYRHNVLVIADEIHCDIVDEGYNYIPFASVCGECLSVSTLSVNKAFNIAGLQGSFNVIPNEQIRQQVQEAFERDEIAMPNSFIVHATIAALQDSREWLDALKRYLASNKQIAIQWIEEKLPFHVLRGELSYLLWIDCSKVTHDTKQMCDFVRKHTGLYLSHGEQFGGNGHDFVRMNIACPLETLQDGLKRFEEGVLAFMKS